MTRRHLALLLLAAIAALSAHAAPAPAATRGGSGVLSENGRVGKVRVGTARVSTVRRWAGRPSSTSRGTAEGGAPMYVMRYGCGRGRSSGYYFDRHGRLANFTTTCHVWRTAAGTRVGDTYDQAVANEQATPQADCGDGETITRSGRASLYVSFFTPGGKVRALAVAGRNSVLGC